MLSRTLNRRAAWGGGGEGGAPSLGPATTGGARTGGGGGNQGRVLGPDGLQRASVECYKNPCRLSRLISLGALVLLVMTMAPRVSWWCCALSTLVLPLESLSWNSSAWMTSLVLMLALLLEPLVSWWSSARAATPMVASPNAVGTAVAGGHPILTMAVAAHRSAILDEHELGGR